MYKERFVDAFFVWQNLVILDFLRTSMVIYPKELS